jgi:SAM-dependent methyltransferase
MTIDDLLGLRAQPVPGRSWRLLDVRSEADFSAGHLPGSVCIPAAEIEARGFELPPKWRPLILLAEDSALALRQASALRRRGWRWAYALGEPLSRWPGPWRRGPTTRVLWEPAPLVRKWAGQLPAGAVLDLGCGAGRDAVFLAGCGHPVTAVDRLPEALEKARALAERCSVALETRCADLRHAAAPDVDGGYAAILMIRTLARSLFAWIPGALRPAGLLLLEAYRDVRTSGAGTPPQARIGGREALAAFQSRLTILEYRESFDRAGDPIVRLVATRPATPPA